MLFGAGGVGSTPIDFRRLPSTSIDGELRDACLAKPWRSKVSTAQAFDACLGCRAAVGWLSGLGLIATPKLRYNGCYMNIDELKAVVEPVCRTFGVNRLDVFGSVARGTVDAASDIDLLVEFANPDTNPAKRFFGLLHRLEDCFGCRVDLLTPSGFRNPFFKAQAFRERVPLYEA